ncbi:MAG: cytochrome c1, partial [Proteobacteria bacterium]|nr:cytochrome c1 [Pseudomonadota bacterium]
MRIDKFAPALAAAALLALPLVAAASEGEGFPPAGNDIRSKASLQRGARNFMNYCSGCHSAKYVRYNRIAKDL